jgi:pimeloyl-ACP methyl ester carboxylesterase
MVAAALREDEKDASPAQNVFLRSESVHSWVRYKRLERGHFVWPQAKDGTPARRIMDYLDQANKQFLPGSTEEQIQVGDHTTMIWDSCGKGLAQEGVPMVLIHALDMDHRFWREVFPALATRGRTIAYDMRGHGRARGAPLTKSLEQLAADLAHLLDR